MSGSDGECERRRFTTILGYSWWKIYLGKSKAGIREGGFAYLSARLFQVKTPTFMRMSKTHIID